MFLTLFAIKYSRRCFNPLHTQIRHPELNFFNGLSSNKPLPLAAFLTLSADMTGVSGRRQYGSGNVDILKSFWMYIYRLFRSIVDNSLVPLVSIALIELHFNTEIKLK